MLNLDVIRFYCKSDEFTVKIEGWDTVVVDSPNKRITFGSWSDFVVWYKTVEKEWKKS